MIMPSKIVSWKTKTLRLPQYAVNVASEAYGARASASSCAPGFSAGGAINGETILLGWGTGNGWQSKPISWHPNWWGEWLRVDLPRETEIDTIIVYNYPEMLTDAPWHALLHYQVQYMRADEWSTIETVRHNRENINVISFDKITAQAIRIWVNRNHFREENGYESGESADEAPRILEVEAYCLQAQASSLWHEGTGEKVIDLGNACDGNSGGACSGGICAGGHSNNGCHSDNGNYSNNGGYSYNENYSNNGSIAIFYDEAFESVPSIDINELARMLAGWGYGVNFLTADELCMPELFSAENFSLFIHPYGMYMPAGTNLSRFLAGGGHLATFGGRAFTRLKQKKDGLWVDTGLDPGVTVSAARYVDYYKPYRDQLGIFSIPNSRLAHVSCVSLNPNQSIAHHPIAHLPIAHPPLDVATDLKNGVSGWMAYGMVGELMPFDETRRYSAEGRLPELNHIAREGMNDCKADVPILWGNACDENYGCVFSYPCGRWIPLLEGFDNEGRNRGPVMSIMPHYEGMYRGSHWLFCGVENADVLKWLGFGSILRDALRYMHQNVVVHSLEPEYVCYRQGEAASFSIIADNMSKRPATIQFSFIIKNRDCEAENSIKPNGDDDDHADDDYDEDDHAAAADDDDHHPLFAKNVTVKLEPASWRRFDFTIPDTTYADDFYVISADVLVEGQVSDHLENSFVVWNPAQLAAGPQVKFKDNFFHFDNESRYVVGARDSGMQLPWQPEENPLGWDRQYRKMRDFGMQITSPVHFDWLYPGLGWGEYDENQPVPEQILRRMDAQVQLAQIHRLIYAPCLFFIYEKIAMQKSELSRAICRCLGERYKTVPGIMFYLFDDGMRHDPDIFNRWTKACVDGFAESGRAFIVTAEIGFRQIWPDAMRLSAEHLTFTSGSVFQQSVGDPVYERLIDMRPVGKSFTVAEFVRRLPSGTLEDFHGYLAPVHVNFGLGCAMAMNWKWGTSYHTIWPSDVVYPGGGVAKSHLYAFRNEALFFRLFSPVYESPPLMVVAPSAFWYKNSEAFTRYMVSLIRKLIEMKVEFACINDVDLERLPAGGVKALLLPLPLMYGEKAFSYIKKFASDGGSVFVIGDLRGADGADRSSAEAVRGADGSCAEAARGAGGVDSGFQWLEELCGIERINGAEYRRRSIYFDSYMNRAWVPWKHGYDSQPWIQAETRDAQILVADEKGRPVVTKNAIGKGSAWYMNDMSTQFPASILKSFFDCASVPSIKIAPDLPTLHVFRTMMHKGPVYTLFTFPWDQSQYDISLDTEAGRITTIIKEQSMAVFGLCGIAGCSGSGSGSGIGCEYGGGISISIGSGGCGGNNSGSSVCAGGVYALETQGDTAIDGRTLVETTAHIMLASLDNKDISTSQALILMPIGAGEVAISTHLGCMAQGEFTGGIWKTYKEWHFADGDPAKITIKPSDLSNLYLLYDENNRDTAAEQASKKLM